MYYIHISSCVFIMYYIHISSCAFVDFILTSNHYCMVMDYLNNGAYMVFNFCYKQLGNQQHTQRGPAV